MVIRSKFQLGRVVITPAALDVLRTAGQSPHHFLALHAEGSWGDLPPEDRKANDAAIAHEGDPERRARVFSAYFTRDNQRLWVITEHDRSATTIFTPEDY